MLKTTCKLGTYFLVLIKVARAADDSRALAPPIFVMREFIVSTN
jgi:hypothetical protein